MVKRTLKLAGTPVETKSTPVQAPAKRLITKPLTRPAKTIKVAKPAVVAPVALQPAPAKAVGRPSHEVVSLYEGPSKGFNRSKSTTRIPVEDFGRHPEYVPTARMMKVAEPLKVKYGATPFLRMNADAGVIKSLGWKGHIEHVEGDAASETAKFRFTEAGLAVRYTAK